MNNLMFTEHKVRGVKPGGEVEAGKAVVFAAHLSLRAPRVKSCENIEGVQRRPLGGVVAPLGRGY